MTKLEPIQLEHSNPDICILLLTYPRNPVTKIRKYTKEYCVIKKKKLIYKKKNLPIKTQDLYNPSKFSKIDQVDVPTFV